MSLGVIEQDWKSQSACERAAFEFPECAASLPHVDLRTCNRDARFYWQEDAEGNPSGESAIRHLFRIAAGLESMAVGETQILGQVREALNDARKAGTTCPELETVFEAAIACARRIHREVDFGALPPSVCRLGLDRVASRLGGLKGKRLLVIGSGRTASLAVQLAHAAGVASISVCNRSPERIRPLVEEYSVRIVDFHRRYEAMASVDLVISATSSPHVVVTADQVPRSSTAVFLDLAVPPDIEGTVPNRISIDDLGETSPSDDATRTSARAEAERLIAEGVAACAALLERRQSSPHRYVIGTRGSKLALVQTELVRSRLSAAYPDDTFEIKVITTTGDRVTDRPISAIGGSGVFAREIERALLSGEIDLAVHSMKDLASELPKGLVLGKSWTRADARDALVSRDGRTLAELPPGSKVATGSVRRNALLHLYRPDLVTVPIRGNVDTRLRKLFEPTADEPQLDALVLAAAGLDRLGRGDVITERLDPTVWIPAANQGQLAIELRTGDTALKVKVDALGDDEAEVRARAELDFLRELNADCHLPVGAFAERRDGKVVLHGLYGRDEDHLVRVSSANEVRRRLAGRIALVGAGPGASDLITVRGLRLLQSADCIVYDRLVSPALLDEAPRDCEKIYVGKSSHSHMMEQDRINALLADCALRHRLVVRLKGGDPFVFGRGGEEESYLRERDIRVEIVPGVTSAVAAAESVHVPVTHRGVAGSFRVITAHGGGESPTVIDFSTMTDPHETLVFLMGLAALERIVNGLLAVGRHPDTPVAVLAQATTSGAQSVFATLKDVVSRVKASRLVAPATIIVGDVVSLRPPLIGQRILYPYIDEPLIDQLVPLQAKGATVDLVQVGKIVPIPNALSREEDLDADWIILTSRHAVPALTPLLETDAKRRVRIAVVGEKTAQAVRACGLAVDFIPSRATSEALSAELAAHLKPTDRVIRLIAKGIDDSLSALAHVCRYEVREVYENVPVDPGTIDLNDYNSALFTSPTAVHRVMARATGRTQCRALGPTTQKALDLYLSRVASC